MKTASKKTVLITAVAIVAAELVVTHGSRAPQSGCCCPSILSMTAFAAEAAKATGANAMAKEALPRLVDLGAGKCVSCKAMAPVLKELKKEYAGRMEVEFIDVWKHPDAAKPYKLKLIPTQIFFDATGKELFRHEGFMSKKDILAKWKGLGIEFKDGGKKEAKK